MYGTILIPSDGSTHAVRAAEHGLYLARAFDAEVHLLSVADIQSAAGLFSAGGIDEAFVDRLEARGEEAIEAVEAATRDEDRVRTAVVRGEPSEMILEYAAEQDADLIAMGTHGRTGVRRYVAGSVTERVVRLAETPVLSVRETEASALAGDYTDVLIPTDGSQPATAAVDHGLAIARQADARVHAVNVLDDGGTGVIPDYAGSDELRAYLEREGKRATDAIAARAGDAGLDVVTDVREGSPAETLLGYADDHGIDLITMGTRGRSGLDPTLLGSTTGRTVRHADVPVLTVGTNGE